MTDRQKAPRGHNSLLASARQTVAANAEADPFWSDFVAPVAAREVNEVPGGQAWNDAIDGAIDAAAQRLGSSRKERQDAARADRQQAREHRAEDQSPTTRAAQVLTREQRADESAQLKSQADAAVEQMTPEQRAAYREAIMDAEIEEAPDAYLGADYSEPDDDEEEFAAWNPSVELQQAEELAVQDELENQEPYVLPGEGEDE